ncbi:2626_t:CDS:2 [Entrophospora sp. SA101]|nr:13837_t:CDS:2 [Entrophospora sp. SA101]CAJ0769289.1 2626_t:CDS:2 [Entrophospora sp. SA101]
METPEEMGDKSSSSSTRAEKWSIYHDNQKILQKFMFAKRRMGFHLDIIDVLCPFYGFTRILGATDDVHEMDFESADVVFDVVVMNMPRW